jgi:F-type H+-transporting ATPase subunit b
VESAKKEIENQKLAALTEVKNQVGLMALDISAKILKKEMHEGNGHDRYVAELVDELKLN